MAEIRESIRPIQIDMICPKCGVGRMRKINPLVTLTVYPPMYPHACTECGYEENYLVGYPYIKWENCDEE